MKTKYFSYKLGGLPKGCQLCVKGRKTVLYVTGICPRKCFYCPLSEKKKDKDVVYANELFLDNDSDDKNINLLIKEAKSHFTKGTGITGGDPLSRIDRTVKYIKALKKEFGKKHHIHLYTSLNLATESNLKRLYEAGLDEIRFHLDFDSEKYWNNLKIAKLFDWDIGVEIPMIPDKIVQTKKIIDFIYPIVSFINLNEFEYSDNGANFSKYKTIDPSTYAIRGSLQSGLKIIDYVEKLNKKNSRFFGLVGKKLNVHLCTAKLKDAVQLKNRTVLKAKSAKTKFDYINSDGLLVRNCVYLKDHSPRKKSLDKLKDKDNVKKYLPLLKKFVEKSKISSYHLDVEQARLITTRRTLDKLVSFGIDGIDVAIVEEYPTSDKFITDVEFLN